MKKSLILQKSVKFIIENLREAIFKPPTFGVRCTNFAQFFFKVVHTNYENSRKFTLWLLLKRCATANGVGCRSFPQRSFLTRLRVGAHTLAVELGRRTRPITPIAKRVCTFCQRSADCDIPNQTDIGNSGSDIIDDEFHFLIACSRFNNTRRTFYSAIATIVPDFEKMDDDKKFLTYCVRQIQKQ